MTEVYVLTHEYSDKSRFQICGVTESQTIADTWNAGGNENHVYKIPFDQIKAIHPYSDGWEEFT